MNRRSYLAYCGTGALAGLTGCLSRRRTGGSGGGPPATGTPDHGDATETTVRTWTEGGTPRHQAPFPPNRDDVDSVVWFREVSDPESSIVLEHSAASVSLPAAELSFALRNNTDRTFETNFYDWRLYRWEGGRWRHVAPRGAPDPLMAVPPGESHTWEVTIDNSDLAEPLVRSEGTDALDVSALGGGHYAFAIDGWWDVQTETPGYENETVCAARFALDGDDLPLEPSGAVTDTRREGDRVVVAAENPRDPRGDGVEAAYVLAREGDAADPEPIVTEQVYRHWPLRDALAHVDADVAMVRVETTSTAVPAFGAHADGRALEYEGQTFRVVAETPVET